MKTKTIVLTNQKGGAFKSTGTVHLAAGLALRGRRVLVIDTDPQAHSTIMLGHKPAPALYDLLVRDTPLKEVIRGVMREQYTPEGMTCEGNLFLIAGNEETRSIPMFMEKPETLRDALAPLDNLIDVVLIDTPPTPSLLSTVVFMAADYALFPTKCESLHFDGLRRALDHRERANESRQDRGLGKVEMLGVIPVMFRAKTGEHQDHYQLLLNRYGDKVWKPIADSIIWAEAARMQRPVFAYAPNTKTAKEAWRMVNELEVRLPA